MYFIIEWLIIENISTHGSHAFTSPHMNSLLAGQYIS